MRITESIKRYRSSYKNWLYVLYAMKRAVDPIRCVLWDGKEILIEHDLAASLTHFLHSVWLKTTDVPFLLSSGVMKFNYQNIDLKMKIMEVGSNKLQINGDLVQVFHGDEYKFLCSNGANIGDTAVYFAINGAEKILAIEPYPYSFEMAQYNIINNGFQDRIQLLQSGYGKDREIYVKNSITNVGTNLMEDDDTGVKVPIMSLKRILQLASFGGNSKINLKVDCEGCEYQMLEEDPETLSIFERIQIEYHYGTKELDKLLTSLGYKVNITGPYKNYNPNSSDPHMQTGFIYAQKR